MIRPLIQNNPQEKHTYRSAVLFSLYVFCFYTVFYAASLAQNPSNLEWKTLETEHFVIHYHQGEERTAVLAEDIAETVYGPVTKLYNYEPDGKVHIVFLDNEDYSNGGAYFYANKIVVYATHLDYEFRNRTNWLKNVITHEFTHIVQLGAIRKYPRKLPGFYLQLMQYQEEYRSDVIYGYPEGIVSYFIPGTVIPAWFAEGVAQNQATGARFDYWDSHRDMILRQAVLNGNILSWTDLSVFDWDGLGNEMVYDHGYSIVRFICERYGEEKLREMTDAMTSPFKYNFSFAIKKTLGISGPELIKQWSEYIKKHYEVQTASIKKDLAEGKLLCEGGYLNIHPSWSPDGKKFLYISNKGQDYGIRSVFIRSSDTVEGGKVETVDEHTREDGEISPRGPDEPRRDDKAVVGGVSGNVAWLISPDSTYTLIYGKRNRANKYGGHLWDLYQYDFKTEKETALTKQFRARYPSPSSDGKKVVFVKNGSGTNNLGIFYSESKKTVMITHFDDGTHLYAPKFSPEDSLIVFSIEREGRSDIAVIQPDGSDMSIIFGSQQTDRDPVWSPDGKYIIFASDKTGIFNLYKYCVGDSSVIQITNVLGGAFCPAVSPDGLEIAFSHYGKRGLEIRTIGLDEYKKTVDPGIFKNGDLPESVHTDIKSLTSRSKDFEKAFTSTAFLPRIHIDYEVVKFGSYFMKGDMLDRQFLFAGAAVGLNLDRDIFALYENNIFRPTIFLEFYNQTRHVDKKEEYPDDDFIIYERIYNLTEVDVGLRYTYRDRHTFEPRLVFSNYNVRLDFSAYAPKDTLTHFRPEYTYSRGFQLSLGYRYKSFARNRDEIINPRSGRHLDVSLDRLYNFYLIGFKQSTILDELFEKYFYNQFRLSWREHIPVPQTKYHTLNLRLQLGLTDRKTDNFYDFYLGGFNQMRGYTFYSLEGRKAAMIQALWRFPIWRDINRQFLHLFFSRMYGGIFADMGRAWDKKALNFSTKGFKRDAGIEIRLDMYSFYGYPTAIELSTARKFDDVYIWDEEKSQMRKYNQRKWKFYFTLLFGHIN